MKFKLVASPEMDESAESKYDRIYPSESENLRVVVKNNLWGGIDKRGKEVIPLVYEELSDFNHGYGFARTSEGYGLIDPKNKIILPFEYKEISEFLDEKNTYFFATKDETLRILSPSIDFDVTFKTNDLFKGPDENLIFTEINFKKIKEFKMVLLKAKSNKSSYSKNSYLIYTGSNFEILELKKEKIKECLDRIKKSGDVDTQIKEDEYLNWTSFVINDEKTIGKILSIEFQKEGRTGSGALCLLKNNELLPIAINNASAKTIRLGSRVFIENIIDMRYIVKELYTLDGELFLPGLYIEFYSTDDISIFRAKKLDGSRQSYYVETGEEVKEELRNESKGLSFEYSEQETSKFYIKYKNNKISDDLFESFTFFQKNNSTYFLAGNQTGITVGDSYGRILRQLPYNYILNVSSAASGITKEITENRESNNYNEGSTPIIALASRGSIDFTQAGRKLTGISFVRNFENQCGVIDSNFKEVVPLIYSRLSYKNDEKHKNYIIATKFNKKGLLTTKNELVLPFMFKAIYNIAYDRGGIYKLELGDQKIVLNPDSLKKYSKKIRSIAYLSPAEVISEYGIGGDEAIENAWVEYHQESYTKQLETERREEELLKEQKRLDRKNKKLLTPSVTRPVPEAPVTEAPEINTESSPEAETPIDRTNEEITKNFYVTQLSSGIQATVRGRGRDYDECRSDLVRRLIQRYPDSTEADYTIEDAPDDAQAQ